MANSIDRLGVIAEVATAAAAVTYPIAKVVSSYLERRRAQNAKRYAVAAAAVEARLLERCTGLEARLAQLERLLREAA
jgi:hypothetical protein